MKHPSFINHTKTILMPGVPLYVYAIKGEYYSILIDTSIYQMKEDIVRLVNDTPGVKKVLITHVHADHIGCNATVKELTGAQFYAAGAVNWIEDLKTHYMEFCIPSEDLPDSPEQRSEIMGLMDGPVHVDVVISEGTVFRPGDDIELRTLSLPGHKIEEAGFLETNSGTLFMGDVFLALAAPFFHGFQTARAFRSTLNKIEDMINNSTIKHVLASHHDPLDQENAIICINQTRNFLNEVEECVINEADGKNFTALWKSVCSKLNKQLEFRGYVMLQVQVNELCEDGILFVEDSRIFRK